ncbi:MAG: SAM-dependent chlorinase/fluorinase [Acidobacteriota bacterium]|jgi:S-adenosylmethionine hydrolase
MPERHPVITLTTDFGSSDTYVAAMKGVLLRVLPSATVVDLTHEVLPHDVLDGAFRLRCGFPWFPQGTIHVVVVDPGVGSARRPLLVVSENHRFLAPDNGVLSLIPEVEEVRSVHHLTSTHYFRNPVSDTFHGRDVFAPAAGWLAKGIDPAQFGERIDDWVRLELPRTRTMPDGSLRGVIWSVDRFGNVVSGISRVELEALRGQASAPLEVVAGTHRIGLEVRSYHEIPKGGAAFLVNAAERVEIAAPRASAARALGLKRGDTIDIRPRQGA